MEDGGSIVEFFFALVPGVLFLFLLQYFQIIPHGGGSDVFSIFVYIVLGLFSGFLLQGCTMFLRQDLGWNNLKLYIIKNENSSFKDTYKTLNLGELRDNLDKNLTEMFYRMDSSMRRDNPSFLPSHFSSLHTFWANNFCGIILFSFVLNVRILWSILVKDSFIGSLDGGYIIVLFLIAIFLIASYIFADKYLKSFYSSILNCYYMKNKDEIEEYNNPLKKKL